MATSMASLFSHVYVAQCSEVLFRTKPLDKEAGEYVMTLESRRLQKSAAVVISKLKKEKAGTVRGGRLGKLWWRFVRRRKEAKVMYRKGIDKLKELQPWPLR